MKRLNQIFEKVEEIKLVKKILKFIEESIFTKYDVGVPLASISIHCGNNVQPIIARLVEEEYLRYHENEDQEERPRIKLGEYYSKVH